MIYLSDGSLQVETRHLPQMIDEVIVEMQVGEDVDDVNMDFFLDFKCPKNVKFTSGKMDVSGFKRYKVVLGRQLTQNLGEVYVQLVIVRRDNGKVLRSLVSRDPLFLVQPSILAADKLGPDDAGSFFSDAVQVLNKLDSKLELIDSKMGGKFNVMISSNTYRFEMRYKEGKSKNFVYGGLYGIMELYTVTDTQNILVKRFTNVNSMVASFRATTDGVFCGTITSGSTITTLDYIGANYDLVCKGCYGCMSIIEQPDNA